MAAAAAAAQLLQSCPTPCDPIDASPPGSSVPGILQCTWKNTNLCYYLQSSQWKSKVNIFILFKTLPDPGWLPSLGQALLSFFVKYNEGLLWWLSGKESTCQCRRHRFNPWSRKTPHCCGAAKTVYHNCWACARTQESQLLEEPRNLEPSLWNKSEVAQSCPTLCDPIDCSLPGSSVHGIFQAIVLEWIAISFSRGSSQPRARTQVSRIVDRRVTVWATREAGETREATVIRSPHLPQLEKSP